jgi:hypothetical protein
MVVVAHQYRAFAAGFLESVAKRRPTLATTEDMEDAEEKT